MTAYRDQNTINNHVHTCKPFRSKPSADAPVLKMNDGRSGAQSLVR
jgi:hypothetical protein